MPQDFDDVAVRTALEAVDVRIDQVDGELDAVLAALPVDHVAPISPWSESASLPPEEGIVAVVAEEGVVAVELGVVADLDAV